MQLRRLEREYQDVLRHEIKIKDAHQFQGLRNVLFEQEETKTAYQLEADCAQEQEPDEEDGFGDFQGYAEINSDEGSADEASDDDELDKATQQSKQMSQEAQQAIISAMGKLSLKKPAWAERVPEKEWLDRIFNEGRLLQL